VKRLSRQFAVIYGIPVLAIICSAVKTVAAIDGIYARQRF